MYTLTHHHPFCLATFVVSVTDLENIYCFSHFPLLNQFWTSSLICRLGIESNKYWQSINYLNLIIIILIFWLIRCNSDKYMKKRTTWKFYQNHLSWQSFICWPSEMLSLAAIHFHLLIIHCSYNLTSDFWIRQKCILNICQKNKFLYKKKKIRNALLKISSVAANAIIRLLTNINLRSFITSFNDWSLIQIVCQLKP